MMRLIVRRSGEGGWAMLGGVRRQGRDVERFFWLVNRLKARLVAYMLYCL